MTFLFLLPLAYLLGSVPFGLLLTKLAGHGDIRAIGSGNIGATNVLRTGNKFLAALTLLLDGGKGAAAVLIVAHFDPALAASAGLAALLGHMFPVWLKFKGGKGVATMIGVLLALSWPVGVFVMLVWLAVALIMRLSSLSALVAVGSAPVFYFIYEKGEALGLIIFMALLVFVKHADNIKRLVNGTEPKIGQERAHDSKTS